MGSRSEARERALHLLYEAETRGAPVPDVIAESPVPLDGFAESLARGASGSSAALDELISTHLRGWTIDRLPVLDRLILRLAVYELRHHDTPVAVVIDEAVELAKRFSTEDSGRFVNGVLASVSRD